MTQPQTLGRLEGIVRLIRLDLKNLQSRTIGLQVDATRQAGGSALFESVAAIEMALVVEMVVDRGTTRDAFELLVLTAARSSEVRLATWEETDLDAGHSSTNIKSRPAPARRKSAAHDKRTILRIRCTSVC